MASNIIFPPLAIKQIANVMATQNSAAPNYMKGPELVNIFNALGYLDTYTFLEGRGIQTMDYGDGLSRLTYTIKRLQDLNKVYQVPNAIQEFANRVREPFEFANSMKKVLEPFKLTQFVPEIKTIPKVQGYNHQDKKEETKLYTEDDTKNTEYMKICNQRRKASEESILGEIPKGRPVVFISYSWDSPKHKEWVAKFADDLTSKGIYVLFDDYLETGTSLTMFMEIGLERADRVLVIGTPSYKEKYISISSGAAFEGSIIRNSMFQNLGTKKFIPCLKEGDFIKSFPNLLSGCKGYNFTKQETYKDSLEDLCHDIYGKPRRSRPKLGEIPNYVKE